jgi:ribosomal protein S18 acetylase RimI-like enzyme
MEIIIEQIKTFSPDMTESIGNLLIQLNPGSQKPNDESVKKAIERPGNHFIVAREIINNKIVGMLTVIIFDIFSGKKGSLEDLVVDENHRGKGIATKLMNYAVDFARKEGLARLDFTSNPKRVEANNLYQHLGFEKRDTNVYRINL